MPVRAARAEPTRLSVRLSVSSELCFCYYSSFCFCCCSFCCCLCFCHCSICKKLFSFFPLQHCFHYSTAALFSFFHCSIFPLQHFSTAALFSFSHCSIVFHCSIFFIFFTAAFFPLQHCFHFFHCSIGKRLFSFFPANANLGSISLLIFKIRHAPELLIPTKSSCMLPKFQKSVFRIHSFRVIRSHAWCPTSQTGIRAPRLCTALLRSCVLHRPSYSAAKIPKISI